MLAYYNTDFRFARRIKGYKSTQKKGTVLFFTEEDCIKNGKTIMN